MVEHLLVLHLGLRVFYDHVFYVDAIMWAP